MRIVAELVHGFQTHSILVMLAIFIVMCAWVYLPARKSSMERHAQIPLEDES